MAIGKSRALIGWKRIAEIREKNIHIILNVEKSLRECEQITLVIVLYPEQNLS